MLSGRSIVSSSRTIRPCSPWGADGLDIGGQDSRRFVLLHHSTGLRGGHTPFVQAGAETFDTSAEAVKLDPRCSWKGHHERMGAGVRDENAESCGIFRPLRIPLVIFPVFRTYVVVVVVRKTDEFLCGGYKRVSRFEASCIRTEWSRCLGSMARRAKDSVAPMRRSSASWMLARIGTLSAGVGSRHPVTVRKASLMAGSMRRVWALLHQTGAQ